MKLHNKYYDTNVIMTAKPPPDWWFEKGKTIKQWCRKVISERHQANQFDRQVAFRQRELAGMLGIDVNELVLALDNMKVDTVEDATPILIDTPKKRKKWWQRWLK